MAHPPRRREDSYDDQGMLRIVSLIASATEIIHALDLGRWQVGRSHECDFPESVLGLPVCTRPAFRIDGDSAEIDRAVKAKLHSGASIYEVFGGVLGDLAPTHIITQTQCKVCAVSLEDVERELCQTLPSRPRIVALEPNCLDDIWLDIGRVAGACGVPERAAALVASLRLEMEAISDRALGAARRPSVACIEWQEPIMAAGNWIPELVDMAGGINLFGRPGIHSPWLNWQELAAADPDVIVVSPCGFSLERTAREMHWLTGREGWSQLKAVKGGHVYLVDGNQYMTRPGPRVAQSLRILAEIFHPDRFEPSLQGTAWVCSVPR